ncbi:MAG TPA: hypothetical protein VGA21_12285 [Cyclobacteriaceae bacterium]|jgi:hypothetical protein
MKKAIVLFIGLALVNSCNPFTGKPENIYAYFVFSQSEGDFFNSEPLYDETELRVANPNIPGKHPFIEVKERDGFHQFGLSGWTVPITYFDYGNGDVDTLAVSLDPDFDLPMSNFNRLKSVKFYLNNILIEEWDFKNHPEKRDSILMFNTEEARLNGFNSEVVIRVPKSPDLDELN